MLRIEQSMTGEEVAGQAAATHRLRRRALSFAKQARLAKKYKESMAIAYFMRSAPPDCAAA